MPVKATGDETSESINTGYDGMLYAAHVGADIINCSWGGPGYSSFMQNQINVLYDQYNAIIVAAAGNGDDEDNPSDEPHYPSGYDNVVSVTAVSSQDVFSWASYGAPDPDNNFYGVDLAAPGENMYSTYLTKTAPYASLRGLSMASPLVASCFGLLKSFYPDSSREWLIRRLVDNTDPIDHINPDYEGELGSGRVNILKAFVSDKWPKLRYVAHEESIIGGDADSVLNPGEDLVMMIELNNDTGWAEAREIMGTLRSDHPGIAITDSIGVWNSIQPNDTVLNDDDGFGISFSGELLPADYAFTLELLSGQTQDIPYKTTLDIVISLYLDQQGFPFYAENEVEASPIFLDVDR
ncbi:MAG: S8 family serine peptidase [Candidatus Marinimicrobia bacterium]|nr:S8 family serine peptidase [Candidatus Neomarinimicrobiota bacterium]